MTDYPRLTDEQLADIQEDLNKARVSLMMFRQALATTSGHITATIHQIGRGTAPLKAAQRDAATYRARWESTVREAKRQHAEADRLRAELATARNKATAHEHSENLLAGVIRDGRQLLAEATSPEQAVTDLHTLLNP